MYVLLKMYARIFTIPLRFADSGVFCLMLLVVYILVHHSVAWNCLKVDNAFVIPLNRQHDLFLSFAGASGLDRDLLRLTLLL